jgi:hypothetical protein
MNIDIESGEDETSIPASIPTPAAKKPYLLYTLFAAPALSNIAMELSWTYQALSQTPDEILGFIPRGTPTTAIILSLYLLQSLAVNGKYMPAGIDDFNLLLQGLTPNSCNQIKSCYQKIAGILTFLTSTPALLNDTIANTYFIQQQVSWHKIACYSIASIASLGSLPTESFEAYVAWHNLMPSLQRKTQLASRGFAKISGFILNIFGALADTIESYAALSLQLESHDLEIQWLLLIFCTSNGMTDFFFNWKNSASALDRFVRQLQEIKNSFYEQWSTHLRTISIFSLALFGAAIITDIQRNLIYTFLTHPEVKIPGVDFQELPEALPMAIASLAASRDFVNNTDYFSVPIQQFFTGCANLLNKFWNYFNKIAVDDYHTLANSAAIHPISPPLSPAHAAHPHRLFSPKKSSVISASDTPSSRIRPV